MAEVVDQQLRLILNSVLLAVYALILLFGFLRIIVAYSRARKFLILFFGLVIIITGLELAIQIYQVVEHKSNNQIQYPVIIAINLYAMVFQTAAIFSISDFWGDTSEILTKQSTQQQLKQQKHWIRISILTVWIVLVSIFIGYAFGTNQVVEGEIQYWIIVLGGQGIGVALVLIANISQCIQGYRVFQVVRNIQGWVSSVAIHKIQFCFLYLTSSIVNFIRCIFLVVITIIVYIRDNGDSQFSWMLFFIYTCSNVPVVIIFFLGFTTKKYGGNNTTLLEEARVSTGTSRSRQTQLSATHSAEKRQTYLSEDRRSKQLSYEN